MSGVVENLTTILVVLLIIILHQLADSMSCQGLKVYKTLSVGNTRYWGN